MPEWTCRQCGECCKNNGMIPPLLFDGRDDELPRWLHVIVARLRGDAKLAFLSQYHRCLFLTDDMRCAIHDVAKPSNCREFDCEKGLRKLVADAVASGRPVHPTVAKIAEAVAEIGSRK